MPSSVQITVLVDNEAGAGLVSEHGLSFWIETAGKRILFDTGRGGALVPNAQKLGIPLEETDVVVLSHGHYDHADGLPDVLPRVPEARMVVHPDALLARYSVRPSGPARAIGISAAAHAALAQVPAENVTWSEEPIFLFDDVGVTGFVPRATTFEDVGGPFFLDEAGQEPDPIHDDQALWVDTDEGVVVCAGCCHSGLINTLLAVQRAAGTSRIRAVIGGFHLLHAGAERLKQTLDALRSLAPDVLIPCHCTGKEAVQCLQDAFGARVSACHSGLAFRFAGEPYERFELN